MSNAITVAGKATPDVEDDDAPLYKEPVRIDPNNVVFDFIGLDTRQVMIRLPIGAIADDLNSNTDLFRNVQTNRTTSLRKFDRLLMVAYDESWVAEALVGGASATTVQLSKPRISVFPERGEKLFNDGQYKVVWMGTGYAVVRIRDNHRMTAILANAPLAERALAQLYPTTE